VELLWLLHLVADILHMPSWQVVVVVQAQQVELVAQQELALVEQVVTVYLLILPDQQFTTVAVADLAPIILTQFMVAILVVH
jgi:hypothetical protein